MATPRTTEEIERELEERENTVIKLNTETLALPTSDPAYADNVILIAKHLSIIDALRWVLGRDLLWE